MKSNINESRQEVESYTLRDKMYAEIKDYFFETSEKSLYLKRPDEISEKETAAINAKLHQYLMGDYVEMDGNGIRKINLAELEMRASNIESMGIVTHTFVLKEGPLKKEFKERGKALLEPHVKLALALVEVKESEFKTKYKAEHSKDKEPYTNRLGVVSKRNISPDELAIDANTKWRDALDSESAKVKGSGWARGGE